MNHSRSAAPAINARDSEINERKRRGPIKRNHTNRGNWTLYTWKMVQGSDREDMGSLFGAGSGEKTASGGWITAYCDGGSRGNPGPSGFGVYLQDEAGKGVGELSEFLGKRTNNYAEYSGLLAALEFALEKGHSRLRVVSDSELMVKQIKGQ